MGSDLLGMIGGLGLFLLGMAVMTEGLKALAGESLRQALARFTSTPLTGAVTGAVGTALIQSSSATTVMAVGFVGAGLLTFPQAVGIILGANVGTTATGWLVALVGFKLNLQQIVLPLIFLGALLRLLGGRRVAAWGFALAGFGLVFAGIGTLQAGLTAFREVATPESFPPDTWGGRLLLVLFGFVLVLVLQSSSAGVAAAVTALHVGNISLPQAAAMVIGMDIGTTITALAATLGGNLEARRTGWTHVLYNLILGTAVFFLLPAYMWAWEAIPAAASLEPELALVVFHSGFNLAGAAVAIPLAGRLAALVVYLVPARDQGLTRRLDPRLLAHPGAAIDSTFATLGEIAAALFTCWADLVVPLRPPRAALQELEHLEEAITETSRFAGRLGPLPADSPGHRRRGELLHVLDHLHRLAFRCRQETRLRTVRETPELRRGAARLVALSHAWSRAEGEARAAASAELEQCWREIDGRMEPFRSEVIEQAAGPALSTEGAIKQLDAYRWLRRCAYHMQRIARHLTPPESALETHPPEPPPPETAADGSRA